MEGEETNVQTGAQTGSEASVTSEGNAAAETASTEVPTGGDTPANTETVTTDVTKEEKKGAVRELIHTRKRAQEAEQRAEYWEKVARGEIKPQQPAQEAQVDPNAEPLPAQFDNYDDYIAAKVKWGIRKDEAKKEQEKKRQTEQQSREQRVKNIEDAAEKNEDLANLMSDEKRWDTLPISEVMFVAVGDSDDVAGLLLYLDKNREEAKKIAKMNPIAAAREIGKIETKLATAKTPVNTQKERVSMAPKPPTQVGGNSSVVVDLDSLSTEEFFRHRNKQQFGR